MAQSDAVAQAATEKGVLDRARIMLIGTLTGPRGPVALIRARGRVERVEPGDRVDGATVRGIDDGVLSLARGSRVETLRLPG